MLREQFKLPNQLRRKVELGELGKRVRASTIIQAKM
jgi:hypothetical protein